MSRIGRTPIIILENVTVANQDGSIVVQGPKGSLKFELPQGISVAIADGEVVVSRANELKHTKSLHGLVRSIINNMIIGVTEGYKKTLKLIGTGYRVQTKGANLSVTVGFSHPVDIAAVEGIKLTLEGNDTIHIEGIDKQLVGQVAANIRKIRPPEPYKGKGIRYEDEVVRRKAGKTASK